MARNLTFAILVALGLGIAVGLGLNTTLADGGQGSETLQTVSYYLSTATDIFLRLIKMIIAPLVFSTLVVGIAHMGDTASLGRVGGRALAWFLAASLLSLSLGLVLVNLLQPGIGLNIPLPATVAKSGVDKAAFDFRTFVAHIVPASGLEAMAENEILQIVVFSLFIGVAITAIGEKAAPLVRGAEALVQVMLQVTNYVMRFAPIAVFAAVASTLAERGPQILGSLGYFMVSFYLAIAILWCLLFAICFLLVGKRTLLLALYIRDPLLLAFTTASSEAAYPRTLEALERFGVPPRIASFILPLGYSFNLDGSMIYMTFATMFIAQAYGIEMSTGQQLLMLLILMVTSKGIAGVPRASLVVIAGTLAFFDIPEAGLLLILAVDHFLDMGRSATNVVGNAVAATVIAKWETGKLDKVESLEIAPVRAISDNVSD